LPHRTLYALPDLNEPDQVVTGIGEIWETRCGEVNDSVTVASLRSLALVFSTAAIRRGSARRICRSWPARPALVRGSIRFRCWMAVRSNAVDSAQASSHFAFARGRQAVGRRWSSSRRLRGLGALQQLAGHEVPHLFSRRTAAFASEPAHGVWILLKNWSSSDKRGNGRQW
jgi:hypothetical protein